MQSPDSRLNKGQDDFSGTSHIRPPRPPPRQDLQETTSTGSAELTSNIASIKSFPRSRQDNAFSWTLKAIERTSPSERLINNRASFQRRPFDHSPPFASNADLPVGYQLRPPRRLERKRKRRVSPWSVDQKEPQTFQGPSVSSITSSTLVTNQQQH